MLLPRAISLLTPRDVLADAKATLGSWDKCMEKSYCKSVGIFTLARTLAHAVY
jgi:hypothetical protein